MFCSIFHAASVIESSQQQGSRKLTPDQIRQIDFVCAEVGKVLAGLLQTPAAKGQQVIIHISKDRREVWIEKPAEMVHIRMTPG